MQRRLSPSDGRLQKMGASRMAHVQEQIGSLASAHKALSPAQSVQVVCGTVTNSSSPTNVLPGPHMTDVHTAVYLACSYGVRCR